MESYGAGTDPTPYIAAAYGLGVLLIAVFVGWSLRERRRLRETVAAARAPERR